MNNLLEGMRQNSTIVIVPSSAVETMGLGAMLGVTSLAKEGSPSKKIGGKESGGKGGTPQK
jgi:hypothetical protein